MTAKDTDRTISALVDGAVESGVIDETGLAKLLHKRVVRSTRAKAKRLLEKGALIAAKQALSETEAELEPLAAQASALASAEAALATATDMVARLKSELLSAEDAASEAVRAGDHVAMHSGAERLGQLDRLATIAETQRQEHAAVVDQMRSDFAFYQYELLEAKVSQLRQAVTSPKRALEFQAAQVEVQSNMLGQELGFQLEGFQQAFREMSANTPQARDAAIADEMSVFIDHMPPSPGPGRPLLSLRDAAETGFDRAQSVVPNQTAPAATKARTNPDTRYLDKLFSKKTRKGSRKQKPKTSNFITKGK